MAEEAAAAAAAEQTAASATAESQTETPQTGKPSEPMLAAGKPAEKPVEKPASTDWRDGLEGDTLEFAKRLASPHDAVKSAYELRKANSALIKPLTDKSTAEEIAAYNKRIGAGEKPEDYKFGAPVEGEADEATKAATAKFAAILHKHHAPLGMASDLQAAVKEIGDGIEAERNRIAVNGRQATEAALRKEWGADFEGNVQLAARAAQAFGLSAEFRNKVVDGIKLGDHPEFLRVFGQIGRRTGEGQFIGAFGGEQRSTLKETIEAKTREMYAAQAKNDRSTAQRLNSELYQLHSQLHGNAPVVGSPGRAA